MLRKSGHCVCLQRTEKRTGMHLNRKIELIQSIGDVLSEYKYDKAMEYLTGNQIV